MRKLIIILLLLLLTASLVSTQDGETLRIGYLPIMVMEQHFIISEQGWYDELADYGFTNVEETRFSSGPPMVQAFAADELDVGFVGINPALVMAARGVPVKVVVGNVVNALTVIASDELATAYEAAPGADGLKAFEAQVGRKIRVATLPQGSTPDTVLRMWMDQLGWDAETDIEILPLGVEQVQTALATGEVDASLIMEPVISLAQEQGWGYRPIVEGSEILNNQPGAVLVVSDRLIAENPEAVQKLVELHLRATFFANENKDEAARIASEFLTEEVLPVEVARVAMDSPALLLTANPYRILESTQAYNDFQVALGVFDEPVPQENIFDLSFYDAVIEAFPEYAEPFEETEATS